MKNFDQLFVNKNTSAVYQITCEANGNQYIGSSTCLRQRIIVLLSVLRRGIHPSEEFQKDYYQYGIESFRIDILKIMAFNPEVESAPVFRRILISAESELIAEKQPLYNTLSKTKKQIAKRKNLHGLVLSKAALNALPNGGRLRKLMAAELNLDMRTVNKYVESNEGNGPLTTVKAVRVIAKETGMIQDEIVVEERAVA